MIRLLSTLTCQTSANNGCSCKHGWDLYCRVLDWYCIQGWPALYIY